MLLARRVSRAFRNVFNKDSPDVQVVLLRLGAFCHYKDTTHVYDKLGRIDPIASALLEGRRQVFIEILEAIDLTEQEIDQMQSMMGGEEYE